MTRRGVDSLFLEHLRVFDGVFFFIAAQDSQQIPIQNKPQFHSSPQPSLSDASSINPNPQEVAKKPETTDTTPA